MAPEQARGASDLDLRIDIWAVGVTLYEALTGALPFDAADYGTMIGQLMTEAPTPPRRIRPDIPEALEDVIMRALSKDRDARYRCCEELVEALVPFADHVEWSRGPVTPSSSVGRHVTPETRFRSDRPTAGTAETTAPHDRPEARKLAPRRPRRAGTAATAAAAAGLSAAVCVLAWLSQDDEPEFRPRSRPLPAVGVPAAPLASAGLTATGVVGAADTVRLPPAPSEAAMAVRIAVEGAPPGAHVYWDGVLVTETPLRVAPSNVMAPLRVVADGYEPFFQMILPTGDRTIAVSMRPREELAPQDPPRPVVSGRQQPDRTAGPARGRPRPAPRRRVPIQTDTSEFRPR
jgi:serine/threonine-protein kinase